MRTIRRVSGPGLFLAAMALLAPVPGEVRGGAREPVHARHAMVVTVEPHATEVGVATLQRGGNAVDAAVAIGLALAVTHPSAGNLGGGGFLLLRLTNGQASFIDFRERAPGRASPNMYLDAAGQPTKDSDFGYRASGVPGTVRGFELAQRKYGRLTWPEVVRPAWQLAERGFPISYGQACDFRTNADRLGRFPDSSRIFLRNGRYFEPGELLRQPELARTLKRIMKDGARDFYQGETARRIDAAMRAHGGLITREDLANYRALERVPLAGSYHGFSILTAPPPSSGGIGILQILAMVEGTGFEQAGAGSARATHYLAEAMRRFFADRSRCLGDPGYYPVPVSALLDPAYIARRRATLDPDRATPSEKISPGLPEPHEARQTTHYSVVDADGNAVSVTYTLNGGYGSGVTIAGTGMLLNNEMDDFASGPGVPNLGQMTYSGDANGIQPGKTPLSSMSPTILLRDGKLYAVLGSPGGPTIINTVLEVILNLVDFKMNVAEAVAWPRFHHQWMPDRLEVERGFSPDTLDQLRARGHRVEVVATQGEVAAIVVTNDGLEGSADPRTEGTARGY